VLLSSKGGFWACPSPHGIPLTAYTTGTYNLSALIESQQKLDRITPKNQEKKAWSGDHADGKSATKTGGEEMR